MYKIILEFNLKENITLKETYEKVSKFIRHFINQTDGYLKETHYESTFSYYTFSNFFPREDDSVFKKGKSYQVELRTLNKEFLQLKNFKGLETKELALTSTNSGKLYYFGGGKLKSETPVFFNTKRIEDENYENEVKEKIRENILFRYLKSGINTNDDISYLRENIVKNIKINKKVITIPFEEKKMNNGKYLLYHCLNIDIEFCDNKSAKEAEAVVYSGGLGLSTSNGFGFMKSEV